MGELRRLLLVEDEPSLVFMLTERLEGEGYRVEAVTDGEAGIARASAATYDVIILDGMLPGLDGFDVCRLLRQRGVRTPILILSARSQVADRVVGLKLGADDYLTKPFEVVELLARLDALLRRVAAADVDLYRFGAISVSRREALVRRDGRPVDLTALEYKLLVYLIDHPGATLSRDELLDAVWGYNATPSTRTVDVHVALLRHKLEPEPHRPRHILTMCGLGYKFVG